MKENEMGGACSTYERLLVDRLEGRACLEDLVINRVIISKQM